MLIKRKKKKEQLDNLKGLKFTHHSSYNIYTISKEIDQIMFTVSWRKSEMADYSDYSGSTTYSREDIVRNIETKVWEIVS